MYTADDDVVITREIEAYQLCNIQNYLNSGN